MSERATVVWREQRGNSQIIAVVMGADPKMTLGDIEFILATEQETYRYQAIQKDDHNVTGADLQYEVIERLKDDERVIVNRSLSFVDSMSLWQSFQQGLAEAHRILPPDEAQP